MSVKSYLQEPGNIIRHKNLSVEWPIFKALYSRTLGSKWPHHYSGKTISRSLWLYSLYKTCTWWWACLDMNNSLTLVRDLQLCWTLNQLQYVAASSVAKAFLQKCSDNLCSRNQHPSIPPNRHSSTTAKMAPKSRSTIRTRLTWICLELTGHTG